MRICQPANNTTLEERYGPKHARIFSSRGYYEDTPEQIAKDAEYHRQDQLNKDRIRNLRNG